MNFKCWLGFLCFLCTTALAVYQAEYFLTYKSLPEGFWALNGNSWLDLPQGIQILIIGQIQSMGIYLAATAIYALPLLFAFLKQHNWVRWPLMLGPLAVGITSLYQMIINPMAQMLPADVYIKIAIAIILPLIGFLLSHSFGKKKPAPNTLSIGT